MNPREKYLRECTRVALIMAIEGGTRGDELFLKEVWEECNTTEEDKIIKHELHQVLKLVHSRGAETT